MGCSAGVRSLAVGTDRSCLAHLQSVERHRALECVFMMCFVPAWVPGGVRQHIQVYLKLGLVVLNEFVDGKEIDGIEFVVH